MNRRFARRVAAALLEAGVPADDSAASRTFYRRAVPTEARAALAPPPTPFAGLRTVTTGDVVLVPHEFADGRFDGPAVDAALHAARTAGAMWAIASVSAPAHVAVLRELQFQPFGGDGA